MTASKPVPKRNIRELSYINKDILNDVKNQNRNFGGNLNSNSRLNERYGYERRGETSRANRTGGLDFYRNRAADRFENSYLRKKHGHLENVAGEMM